MNIFRFFKPKTKTRTVKLKSGKEIELLPHEMLDEIGKSVSLALSQSKWVRLLPHENLYVIYPNKKELKL